MTSSRNLAALAALSLIAAGCATRPGNIEPSYVQPGKFDALSCADAGAALAANERAYRRASVKQNASNGLDFVTILLIGAPASSLGGGNVKEVGRLKGEREALLYRQKQACAG